MGSNVKVFLLQKQELGELGFFVCNGVSKRLLRINSC